MTSTEILREKVKKYIDHANKKSLLIVEQILETKQDDWWDTLPAEVKLSVKDALKEIDNGKGIPHEEVKKMYPQWFKK